MPILQAVGPRLRKRPCQGADIIGGHDSIQKPWERSGLVVSLIRTTSFRGNRRSIFPVGILWLGHAFDQLALSTLTLNSSQRSVPVNGPDFENPPRGDKLGKTAIHSGLLDRRR